MRAHLRAGDRCRYHAAPECRFFHCALQHARSMAVGVQSLARCLREGRVPDGGGLAEPNLRGPRANVQWRAVPRRALLEHPRFRPLPDPRAVRAAYAPAEAHLRLFAEQSPAWRCLREGRVTSTMVSHLLGLHEPKAAAVLGLSKGFVQPENTRRIAAQLLLPVRSLGALGARGRGKRQGQGLGLGQGLWLWVSASRRGRPPPPHTHRQTWHGRRPPYCSSFVQPLWAPEKFIWGGRGPLERLFQPPRPPRQGDPRAGSLDSIFFMNVSNLHNPPPPSQRSPCNKSKTPSEN